MQSRLLPGSVRSRAPNLGRLVSKIRAPVAFLGGDFKSVYALLEGSRTYQSKSQYTTHGKEKLMGNMHRFGKGA